MAVDDGATSDSSSVSSSTIIPLRLPNATEGVPTKNSFDDIEFNVTVSVSEDASAVVLYFRVVEPQ